MNNVSFEEPSVPILLQILSGAKRVQDLVPSGSIYGLNRSEVVELTIPAGVVGGPVSPVRFYHSSPMCDALLASCPSSWPFLLGRSQRREQYL